MTTAPAPSFDVSKLTDSQLSQCLEEMRRRGAAVAIYDVAEIVTMTDGWDNQPEPEAFEAWFDREHMEEVMCAAARREISSFVDHPDDHEA